jgi:predicted PP-loop superfamily ATPase
MIVKEHPQNHTMKNHEKKVRALGLCSGGLDSILSAVVLRNQGVDVEWIAFETPFSHQRKPAGLLNGFIFR